MNNFINKINSIHSLIFFLAATIYSISVYKFKLMQLSPLMCFFLILIIGVSHGAYDHIKGRSLLKIYNINNIFIFYLSYILVGLIVIFTWFVTPSISLLIFLIFASFHFGKEDSQFLLKKRSITYLIFFVFKGLLIVTAPLYFNFVETINIFKLLLIENENFYRYLDWIESKNILITLISLSFLVNILLIIVNFKISNLTLLLDFASILILNYFLSPLVAFTIYFCFLHSIRHIIAIANEVNNRNFYDGLKEFIKKASTLAIVTVILFILALIITYNYFEINDAILKIIFIGLASLTFPHILLEYLLEKNEK
ncbi:MAG: Brp/Blh family beta-carotene 15,15'-dioxygenase [Candidatus Pelagibacter sp.]